MQSVQPGPLLPEGDPRVYSSGRWLRGDSLERESRYIRFDFAALCKRATELCPGATFIVTCEKKEGGYNRVFIFTMNNKSRVVARLPTRIAGPPKLITNSEVATIKYLKSSTRIPIPKILDWSDSSTNAIGSEYIIMEHAKGVQLHQIWPAMSLEQQIACTGAVIGNVKQMAALDFHAYGSLYLEDVDIDPSMKHSITSGYVIGPHCGNTYWDCEAHEPRYYGSAKPNRGPWFDLATYCSALIDVGVTRLPPIDAAVNEKPSYHGAVAEHKRLLSFGRDVASRLIEDSQVQKAAAPILLHQDLHKRNIYVSDEDPTIVTDIIDWQSSSINPSFMHANDVPDFAAHVPTIDDDSPSEKSRAGDNAKFCNQAFIAGMRLLVPKVHATWELDDDVTRFFEYCHRTYRDGAGILRQILMDLANHWEHLGLAGPCPYPLPTSEEWVTHNEEYKALEDAQKLKKFVTRRLNTASDGWVPTDAWKETKEDYKKLYDHFSQTMSQEDLRQIWPFDKPCSDLEN
ncbi:MAG: hypothetical protein LQ339_006404 [Xanthoria mediterranea]|nr:MAG: hypothetical protein LQ339_006404 [Xanthoria mediterranea]